MAEAGSIQHLLMENVPAASTVPGNEGATLNKKKANPPFPELHRTWEPIRKHRVSSRETQKAGHQNVRSGSK